MAVVQKEEDEAYEKWLDKFLHDENNMLTEEYDRLFPMVNNPYLLAAVALMWRHLPWPLSNLSLIEDVQRTILRPIGPTTQLFKLASIEIERQIASMKPLEYYDLLHRRALKSAKFNTQKTYLPKMESMFILVKWLKDQFDDKWLERVRFLWNMIMQIGPRKHLNCAHFYGNPDCGKTYIFEAMMELFVLYVSEHGGLQSEGFPIEGK